MHSDQVNPMALFWRYLGIVLMYPGMQLVFRPLRVYFRMRVRLQPAFRQTRFEELAPPVKEFLLATVKTFAQIGFVTVENGFNENSVPLVQSIQLLMVNRRRGDLAVVIITWGRSGRRRDRSRGSTDTFV